MSADSGACTFGPDSAYVNLAADVLRLLSDPTRIKLILVLRDTSELSVSQLADVIGTSPTCTSQHLAKLRLARVVDMRHEGNRAMYHLVDCAARELVALAVFQAERALGGALTHRDGYRPAGPLPASRGCPAPAGHRPKVSVPALDDSSPAPVPA